MIYEIENLVLVNGFNPTAKNFEILHYEFRDGKDTVLIYNYDGVLPMEHTMVIRLNISPLIKVEFMGVHSAESLISEKKCQKIVEKDYYGKYLNYQSNYTIDSFKYAYQSLNSLLKANDLHLVNSIDESGNSFEWFERESRTGPFIVLKRK